MTGDQPKIWGGTDVSQTVPVAQATDDEAVLPERVQEAQVESDARWTSKSAASRMFVVRTQSELLRLAAASLREG